VTNSASICMDNVQDGVRSVHIVKDTPLGVFHTTALTVGICDTDQHGIFICCFSAFGVACGRDSDAEDTGPSMECPESPTSSEHLGVSLTFFGMISYKYMYLLIFSLISSDLVTGCHISVDFFLLFTEKYL